MFGRTPSFSCSHFVTTRNWYVLGSAKSVGREPKPDLGRTRAGTRAFAKPPGLLLKYLLAANRPPPRTTTRTTMIIPRLTPLALMIYPFENGAAAGGRCAFGPFAADRRASIGRVRQPGKPRGATQTSALPAAAY